MDKDTLREVRRHITQGVGLDFIDGPPPPRIYKNTPSVRLHAAAVRARLLDYQRIHAVQRLPPSAPTPSHVQPLHVIVRDDKKPRVVIDLSRNLNDFLKPVPLRYESVDSAVAASHPGCWFTKLDLSDCFLSFPLCDKIKHLFTFEFEGEHWQFLSMAFGLSSAPAICTKILSVLAFALLRARILHSRYLDDFLLISRTQEEAWQHLAAAGSIIAALGLVVNDSKTVPPTQEVTYLGVGINSITRTLACTRERVEELLQLAATFAHRDTSNRRQLQSLLGKLSFASQVLVGARPFLRSIIDLAHSTPRDHTPIPLTPSFHDDLTYWCAVLQRWNGIARWRDEPNPIIISTDASYEGFGIYVEQVPLDLEHAYPGLSRFGVAGLWGSQYKERQHHIGVLEFFAVLYAAHLLAPLLTNRTLHIHSDNESDVAIIGRQSTRSPDILLLLRALYSLAARHNFSIRAFHRPGVDNITADYLSRPDKHQYNFSDSASLEPLFLSSVTLMSSDRVHMLPLRQALASNTLELSLFSPPSPFASTPASPTARSRADSSASASSSATTPSSL